MPGLEITRITEYFPRVDNKDQSVAHRSSDTLRAPEASCSSASGQSELQVKSSGFVFKKPLPRNSDHKRVSNKITSSTYNANSVKKGLRHLHKSSQIQKSATSSPRGISNKGTISNKTTPIPKSLNQNTNKWDDEVLILTTFSKIKKTRISRGCQTDISLIDTPRCPTKLSIYSPD